MPTMSKALTILFRLAETPFVFAEMTKPEVHEYACMRRIPLAEMISSTPVELAEEVITLTVSSGWRRQGRRPLMCGDIFAIGPQGWLYAKYADVEANKTEIPPETAILRLKTWPNYVIINMPADKFEEALCHPQ